MPPPRRKPPGILRWLLRKVGLSQNSRKVQFHEQTSVFEFERQIGGGGGVPDGDAVALGLGPRCAHFFPPVHVP